MLARIGLTAVWGCAGKRHGDEAMLDAVAVALMLALVIAGAFVDYRRSPYCHWCDMRHRGLCIYNPSVKGD